MIQPSGPAWCNQFPCSVLTTNLVEPFRTNVERFLTALRNAGATVAISTTYRPAERAYLMHWAYRIAHGLTPASVVPSLTGVAIDWTHAGDNNAAVHAATLMCQTYGLVVQPVLQSRHTEGRAIDMTIGWRGTTQIKDSNEVLHVVKNQESLWVIGASYGVHKLPSDPPHWSDDGH
jgi:D-alanyl-D-alanine dipeptidase